MFSNKNNFEGKNSTVTISDSYVDSNTTRGATVIFTKLIENYDFNNFIHFYTENCSIGKKKSQINSLIFLNLQKLLQQHYFHQKNNFIYKVEK